MDPDAAIAFATADGGEDLVVANAGDGALSLYEQGPEGLELMSTENEPGLPAPTALAFSTLTGGQVQFYAATAGRESAELVSLSLSPETSAAFGPFAALGRAEYGGAARVVARTRPYRWWRRS